jgi:hypothetical protein
VFRLAGQDRLALDLPSRLHRRDAEAVSTWPMNSHAPSSICPFRRYMPVSGCIYVLPDNDGRRRIENVPINFSGASIPI